MSSTDGSRDRLAERPLCFEELRQIVARGMASTRHGQGTIETEEIMRRYDRGARMLADLKYVPFPDLSDVLPELCKDPSNVVRLRGGRG